MCVRAVYLVVGNDSQTFSVFNLKNKRGWIFVLYIKYIMSLKNQKNTIIQKYKLYKKNRKFVNFKDIVATPIKKCKIAIIIPYRNREEHLADFINHFNKLDNSNISESQLDVYIIEQNNEDKFNRGLLLNIGYLLARENTRYDRYIFHDVDLFPSQFIYEVYFVDPKKQIHYIIPKEEHKYNFENYFGGVVGLSEEIVQKVNGYPNNFFGWGGEDDSLYNRITANNIEMYRPTNGGYELAIHDAPTRGEINREKQENILNDLKDWRLNGINQLMNMLFINIEKDEKQIAHFPQNTNKNMKYLFYKINYLSKNKNVYLRFTEEINKEGINVDVEKIIQSKRKKCRNGYNKTNRTKKCIKQK